MPRKMLTDEEIDIELMKGTKKLSPKERQTLIQVSNKGWFRSYAKKSKIQLRKIKAKVKKGIKQGKFVYHGLPDLDKEPTRGFAFPKGKKGVKLPWERKKPSERKYTPETKVRVQSASKKYSDASNYELRHGVLNSKASKEYRMRHYGHKEYTGRIIK